MEDKQPQSDSTPQQAHDGPGVEPDRMPVATIFVLLGAATVGVALVGLGLWQVFNMVARQGILDKDLALPNAELAELRARDQGALARYDVIDRDAGRYQIPIDRAMKLLVANPRLLTAVALDGGAEAQPGGPAPDGGGEAEVAIDGGVEAGGDADASK